MNSSVSQLIQENAQGVSVRSVSVATMSTLALDVEAAVSDSTFDMVYPEYGGLPKRRRVRQVAIVPVKP